MALRRKKTIVLDDGDGQGQFSRNRKMPEANERLKKRTFVYGNYMHYYNYRVLNNVSEDPRLKYFKKEWFEGKDCLDVGCNAGNLTISIAQLFSCRKMVGIDIDRALVHKAQKLLMEIAQSSDVAVAEKHNTGAMIELKEIDSKEHAEAQSTSGREKSKEKGLLERISFRIENFIEHVEATPLYDTVLCLSVTKWVHLNWGDDGLIRLFAKIRNLLRPGGILVLEPQLWKSYTKKHLVSETVRRNYLEIILRPEKFREILLDKIGFRTMESISASIVNSSEGFNRPIYLLRC